MPTIQNFALHPFDFPLNATKERPRARLSFPAGVVAGGGKVRPSETVVDNEDLAVLKDHDIANVWFAPGALAVKPEAAAVVEEEPKVDETAAPAQGEGGAK